MEVRPLYWLYVLYGGKVVTLGYADDMEQARGVAGTYYAGHPRTFWNMVHIVDRQFGFRSVM